MPSLLFLYFRVKLNLYSFDYDIPLNEFLKVTNDNRSSLFVPRLSQMNCSQCIPWHMRHINYTVILSKILHCFRTLVVTINCIMRTISTIITLTNFLKATPRICIDHISHSPVRMHAEIKHCWVLVEYIKYRVSLLIYITLTNSIVVLEAFTGWFHAFVLWIITVERLR